MDEVYLPDGSLQAREVGGAGAYAAVGASLAGSAWSTLIVSGAGRRDRGMLELWFREREVDTAGLFLTGERSPLTRIRYSPDGERIEEPAFGIDHFQSHTPLPRHVPVPHTDLAAVYLFHDTAADYWDRVLAVRARWSGPVMWEIAANACLPANDPAVCELSRQVDVLSLNSAESRGLFGSDDPADVWASLGRPGLSILLRNGKEGSILLEATGAWKVGIAPGPVGDPTGGGNSYSGAFLAALATTGRAGSAAGVAAAAASLVIAHVGAPRVHDAARAHLAELALAVPVTRIA
jgi:sugar/nucleoside kinase (ribokinase family)